MEFDPNEFSGKHTKIKILNFKLGLLSVGIFSNPVD